MIREVGGGAVGLDRGGERDALGRVCCFFWGMRDVVYGDSVQGSGELLKEGRPRWCLWGHAGLCFPFYLRLYVEGHTFVARR